MRSILLGITLCLISTNLLFAQQTGMIKGRIIDGSQQPVSYVNVGLTGTGFGDATNNNGEFIIENIPAGTYRLKITAVGYKTEMQQLHLEPGQTLTIKATLFTENEQLPEIIVTSNKINKFSARVSSYVNKMPIKRISNPQVYNTITSELLESQVVTNFSDALTNAPGIFKLWESTGRGGDGAGYYSLRGFAVQPTMVNGLPLLTDGTLEPSNIKRIEIIKGPSGTLYGSSLISYGGLINVVTKKPYNYFEGELSYASGSFGLNRVTSDINIPVSENIALRALGAYQTGNSFQDAGFNESIFIAPSLAYEVNDRLSFLINSAYNHSESTNATMLFLNRSVDLEFNNLDELNYNYKNSFTSNDVTIANNTFNLQAQMNYKFNNRWTSQTALSRSSAKSDGYYTYLYDLVPENSLFARYASNINSTTLATDLQQNFIGNFTVAGLSHKMVAGVDYFQQRTINNSSGYILFDKILLHRPDNSGISRPSLQNAFSDIESNKTTTQQKIYSAYFSDVVNITPRLSTMMSLRFDYFNSVGLISTDEDNYTQTALSPKFGVVYQPVEDKISLFANYMNGFSNVAPRIQDDGSTITFEPERANQWETGIKTDLFGGRLIASLSYYDITVSNTVRPDPDRVNFFIQDGQNYSRGIEASITAAPLPGLNLIAGYSYNESEITKTSNDAYRGRRPESAGPQHLANVWASYRFTGGLMRGFGLGFGGNYAGENLTLNRATTGVFVLPSFTVFNASIFYNTPNYRIDLKVNNISDEIYYKGWTTINPQQPRNIIASFAYKF